MLKNPTVASRLKDLGAVPVGGSPERLARMQRSSWRSGAQVVKAAGVKPD